jgi:PEP-CTERM motif
MKLKTNIAIAVAGASALLASCSVFAATVYDVPHANDATLYSDAREYGDQITLGGLAAERRLTGFSVEYSANYSFVGGAVVKFYENDGIGGAPSTLLYQSAPLNIVNGGGIYNISFAQPIVPDTFTYTVQFLNVTGANQAGLVLPNADATVGSSLNDFWVKNGATWQLNNLGATKANFTASVTAVPEPGTYALAGVAGFAWLAFAGYRRFRK